MKWKAHIAIGLLSAQWICWAGEDPAEGAPGRAAGQSPAAPLSGTEAPPAAVEPKPEFDILDLQIEGNTVLDIETIEQAVYPFVGPGKGLDDVEKARTALEAAYRERGFSTVLVEIPEQDVKDGVVRLQVVEGTVEYVRVSGSRYHSPTAIRAEMPELAEGKVPHLPTVQSQVEKLAEQTADRKVSPIFRAGSTPGKMEVELQVDDRLPLHGSVEMNSRSTEYTTYSRLIGSIRYDNLWQRFHSASLQYQVSPQNSDELEVWSGTYVLPVGWNDLRLAMYGIGISSNTALGANVGGTAVVGAGSIYGIRLMKPLPAFERYTQSLTLGFDYKDFNQSVSLVGEDTGTSPIHYAPFLVGYDGIWRTAESVTAVNLTGHFSIRGLGNNSEEFEEKRFNAKPNYIYFTTDIRHQQAFPYDLRLFARLSGQIADQPLISNEQFAVGGPQSVRGYYQTQQLGDDGLNLSIELHSPRLFPDTWDFAQNFRIFTFFDWAYLWIIDPLSGNPGDYQLASTGVGLRTQLFNHLTGELDWGYPFYRQGTVDVGNQRVDFRMAYEF